MFSRTSRYRNIPDIVFDGPQGRLLISKDQRLLPDVKGTFQHTVEEGDRLDHLGFTYYQQPRKWWRICDANPEFLSPLDLLGQGPILTVRFALALPAGGEAAWAAVAKGLAAEPGVERFRFLDDVRVTPEPQTIGGQPVTVNVERHEFAAVITFNQLVISAADVGALLVDAGFTIAQRWVIGQVGKGIMVPPDVVS